MKNESPFFAAYLIFLVLRNKCHDGLLVFWLIVIVTFNIFQSILKICNSNQKNLNINRTKEHNMMLKIMLDNLFSNTTFNGLISSIKFQNTSSCPSIISIATYWIFFSSINFYYIIN